MSPGIIFSPTGHLPHGWRIQGVSELRIIVSRERGKAVRCFLSLHPILPPEGKRACVVRTDLPVEFESS